MAWHTYHTRKIGEHTLAPETQMMGYGYDPSLSEGALKPSIFLTSTFTFETAQEGKDFFDVTSGRRVLPEGNSRAGLFPFQQSQPGSVEDRLALWEGGARGRFVR